MYFSQMNETVSFAAEVIIEYVSIGGLRFQCIAFKDLKAIIASH